ncbi:hypothetical protein POR1_77 [Pseudomonas phage POR1]|uniref:Tail fiber protein n=1 Tax=Pseudomonas phage POR1 TaxID=1718594 RepID=A0A0N9SJI6_9CAUD|nr:hypothetical protein POR1_77 [Pseudomonas phage POR1]
MADENRIVEAAAGLQSSTENAAMLERSIAIAQQGARAAAEAEASAISAGATNEAAHGILLAVQNIYSETEKLIEDGGIPGGTGPRGYSAYEIAQQNGFVGTEAQWLASLKVKGDKGDPGVKGDPGAAGTNGTNGTNGTAATVAVGTVSQGTTPSVTNSGTASAAVLNFVLQKGDKGDKGDAGAPGASATIQIGTVGVGSTPSVTNSGTASAAVLNFVLQKGDKGDKGEQGIQGIPGTPGVNGVGVPAGGNLGQALVKVGTGDYQTAWRDVAAGGSGGETGQSVLTNVLTSRRFGRMKVIDGPASVTTFHIVMELQADFVGLRVGIPNLHTAPVNGVKVYWGVTNELKGANNYVHPYLDGGFWLDPKFNGQSSVNLPARLDEECPSITYSDIVGFSSIDRVETDRKWPLLVVRVEFPANSKITVPYTDVWYWRTTGEHRTMRISQQNVAGVTTPSSYTATAAIDENAFVPIIQYTTRRAGVQLFLCGDSTTEGLGNNVRDYGAVQTAANRLTTKDYPFEYYNAGLHAQGPLTYSKQLALYLNDVKPSAVFYQPYSINNTPTGGMNSSTYGENYLSLTRYEDETRKIVPRPKKFFYEGLPCNTAYRNTGAGDALRRQWNAWLKTWTGTVTMEGYAAAITGTRDENGQDQIKDGLTNDNVHPNAAGYETLAAIVTPYLKTLAPSWPFQ